MTDGKQMIVAAGLVVAAAAVTGTTILTGQDGASRGGSGGGGHDHSAMGGGQSEDRPVHLTSEHRRRIGVTFARAREERLERSVRAVGTVTYDERRLVSLNPRVEGWVEKLYVDFTGAEVREGQPMLRLYSPELVAVQEELLLAGRLKEGAAGRPGSRAARNAEELLSAARRRLDYWDVPEDEIRRVEAEGEPDRSLMLRAPASGIVVEKHVQEGARVGPGASLYHIADLSTVWIEAEVFEKDLALVREGQEARVTFRSYPGERFPARVTYVFPSVSVGTRTGRVRLELSNPDGRLKPGMYAEVRLTAPLDREAITVPQTAVLETGERSLVFVRRPGDGALVPRAVRTGFEAGDRLAVLEGLAVGEEVVSSAAFLVDAESSLGALTSGADPGGMEHEGHAAGEEPDAPPPSAGAGSDDPGAHGPHDDGDMSPSDR